MSSIKWTGLIKYLYSRCFSKIRPYLREYGYSHFLQILPLQAALVSGGVDYHVVGHSNSRLENQLVWDGLRRCPRRGDIPSRRRRQHMLRGSSVQEFLLYRRAIVGLYKVNSRCQFLRADQARSNYRAPYIINTHIPGHLPEIFLWRWFLPE